MRHKKATLAHWKLLLVASFLMTGNYFNFDFPASVAEALQQWLGSEEDKFRWQLSWMYSSSSLPNIFFPVIGGLLVDRIGPGPMIIVFSALVLIGQVMFALALSSKNFALLLVGRTLFGLGGESLEVAVASILTDWFSGRGLAFALAINLAYARVVTASNDAISPILASKYTVVFAAWVGVGFCVFSFMNGLMLIWMNRDCRRLLASVNVAKLSTNEETRPLLADERMSPMSAVAIGHEEEYVQEIFEHRPADTSSGSSSRSQVINTNTAGLKILIDEGGYESEEFDEEDEQQHLSQCLSLSRGFWLLCAVTIFLYGATIPFFQISTILFRDKWNLDSHTAGLVMSIPEWIAAIGTPAAGLVLDKVGHRANFLAFAALMLVLGHTVIEFSFIFPTLPMILIGIGFSIFAAALWPCVPLLVPDNQIATGYGFLAVALNISLFAFPLVLAQIRNASVDFSNVEYTFILISTVGCMFSYTLGQQYPSLNLCLPGVPPRSPTEGYRRVILTPISPNEPGSPNNEDADEVEDEGKLVARFVAEHVIAPTPPTLVHHYHHREFGNRPSTILSRPRSADYASSCSCCRRLATTPGEHLFVRSVSPVRRRIHYFASVASPNQ
ncbi:major facilitator superfamily domain-containing protein [Obelidium mucronatum]|nr:major facilitator superfamily domain-containing protein [Obelidium mucronatum]